MTSSCSVFLASPVTFHLDQGGFIAALLGYRGDGRRKWGICINGSQQMLANVGPSVSHRLDADAPWGASWSLSEVQPLAKCWSCCGWTGCSYFNSWPPGQDSQCHCYEDTPLAVLKLLQSLVCLDWAML